MAATQGEQFLIIELSQLAAGQAAGSFGPGQALALLVGFVKLRDRVDQLAAENAGARLEAAITALQQTVSDIDDRVAALELERVTDEATIADQAAQIGDLQARVAVLEENQPPPPAPAPA